jgi:hypothetical protein
VEHPARDGRARRPDAAAGPHQHRRRAADPRRRVHPAARAARHHHPRGRLIFHVFAALAEFICELIVAGTHEGLAAARARGRVGRRPVLATADIIRAARDLLPNPEASITAIAKLLGVSPGTLYNHIPDLRELRAAGRARAAAEDAARAARVAALPPDSRRALPAVDQYDQLLTGGAR